MDTPPDPTRLESLPASLQALILQRLSPRDLGAARSTSRALRDAAGQITRHIDLQAAPSTAAALALTTRLPALTSLACAPQQAQLLAAVLGARGAAGLAIRMLHVASGRAEEVAACVEAAAGCGSLRVLGLVDAQGDVGRLLQVGGCSGRALGRG